MFAKREEVCLLDSGWWMRCFDSLDDFHLFRGEEVSFVIFITLIFIISHLFAFKERRDLSAVVNVLHSLNLPFVWWVQRRFMSSLYHIAIAWTLDRSDY